LDPAVGVADRVAFRAWARDISGTSSVSIELGNNGFAQLDEWYDFLEVCSSLVSRGTQLAFRAGGLAAEALRSFGVKQIGPLV
jgi:hypothetical protein